MLQKTGSKSHECKVEYSETEVSTVKLTYTDDQGTSYFVTGALNTTVGSESFSWGGILAGTDIGGGSGGAGGGTEVTDLQIGDVITNFVSNKKSELDAENIDWIYFGTDSNGNNLLTTSKPISNKLTLSRTAYEWAMLEDDNGSINNICSQYIGDMATKARSITLEDINNVIGFNESDYLTDDYTFSFGSNMNFSAKQVNFWYPSKLSSDYWQNPAEVPMTFKRNDYVLGKYNGSAIYLPPGATGEGDIQDITDIINSNYLQYIFGKESNYSYALATGAVIIDKDVKDGEGEGVSNYNLRIVEHGFINVDECLCGSGVDGSGLRKFDATYLGDLSVGIRPIIVIPETFVLTKAS